MAVISFTMLSYLLLYCNLSKSTLLLHIVPLLMATMYSCGPWIAHKCLCLFQSLASQHSQLACLASHKNVLVGIILFSCSRYFCCPNHHCVQVTWLYTNRLTQHQSHDPTPVTWPITSHMTHHQLHDPSPVTWPDSSHITHHQSHDPSPVTWPITSHMTWLQSHDLTPVTWP